MPLSQSDVVELAHDRLLPAFWHENKRVAVLDKVVRWDAEKPPMPRQASRELKALAELSRTPWLQLVVTTTVQAMYVDGYRSPNSAQNAAAWDTWNANDFDQRQIAVHRGALTHGTSYVTVLPGTDSNGPRSVMRGASARRMLAVYADPAEDDWPLFAIRVEKAGDRWAVRVIDEEAVYFLDLAGQGDAVSFIDERVHGAGVCPVVRFANLDLDGRSAGDVEPFVEVARRIDKTTNDRLLAQHYNSWKVRTVAGMAKPDDDADAEAAKLLLRQGDLLVADDPDTKFGTLDETPLDGFIRAHASDIEALAAVTQVPSHNLTGQMVNLSAEALAAARASLNQKVAEWQKAFGKSHEQALRLAATLEGDTAGGADYLARVSWQDTEIRSMSQAVDALGKAAQMLGVPPQALWGRIPGVTQSDVLEWKREAQDGDALGNLFDTLNRQAAPTPSTGTGGGSGA